MKTSVFKELRIHRASLVYDTREVYQKFANYVLSFSRASGLRLLKLIASSVQGPSVYRIIEGSFPSSSIVFVVEDVGGGPNQMAFSERLIFPDTEVWGELIVHVTRLGLKKIVDILKTAVANMNGNNEDRTRLHPFETQFVAASSAVLTIFGAFETPEELRIFNEPFFHKEQIQRKEPKWRGVRRSKEYIEIARLYAAL